MTMTIDRPTNRVTGDPFRVEMLDHTASEESWISNAVRHPFLGEAWRNGQQLLTAWVGGPKRFRVMREGDDSPWADSDCPGCYEAMKGAMYPTHHVSKGCEHGGEPHCTGDGCF